jgi:hypothetical protein
VEKIKLYITRHRRAVAFAAIVFFVASVSFGLGYAADRQFNHAPIIIEKCSDVTNPYPERQ